MSDLRVFVGVDLGTTAPHHAVALGDGLERSVERRFGQSGSEIREFVDWAVGLAPSAAQVVVGLEAPHGAVVEELLERGVEVYHLNPKQLDRFRERESVAGPKDDRRDARTLAERLRTDLKCYRRVIPTDPVFLQLRELSREREQLIEELRVKANQLRDQLHRCRPELLRLCPGADEPWLWDVAALCPSRTKAKDVRKGKLRDVLKGRRIRRIDLKTLLEAVRADTVRLAPGVAEVAEGRIRRLAKSLSVTHGLIGEVEGAIKLTLEAAQAPLEEDSPGQVEQRDASIVLSMPGVGLTVGATLLGEASAALHSRDYELLRRYAGVAPVSQSSGKRSGHRAKVSMRRACNPRLRQALFFMARAAAKHDPAARAHYRACRERGQEFGRALRSVADRLLRILFAALRSRTLYDPNRLTGTYATKAVAA